MPQDVDGQRVARQKTPLLGIDNLKRVAGKLRREHGGSKSEGRAESGLEVRGASEPAGNLNSYQIRATTPAHDDLTHPELGERVLVNNSVNSKGVMKGPSGNTETITGEPSKSDQERKLREAIDSGDVDEIRNFVSTDKPVDAFQRLREDGVEVNRRFEGVFTTTVLHIAAEEGQKEIVELLLPLPGAQNKDSVINAIDAAGRSALHIAAEKGKTGVVEVLIAKGADVGLKDGCGWTPLHCAATQQDEHLVGLLVDEILRSKLQPPGGMRRLLPNRHAGRPSILEATDDTGKTALHRAAMNKQKGVMKVLLDKAKSNSGPDDRGTFKEFVNLEDRNRRTALFFAAEKGSTGIVEQLLHAEANIRAADLNIAAKNGKDEVIRTLATKLVKDRKQLVTLVDEGGKTALHWAAEKGYASTIDVLLDEVSKQLQWEKTIKESGYSSSERSREPSHSLDGEQKAGVIEGAREVAPYSTGAKTSKPPPQGASAGLVGHPRPREVEKATASSTTENGEPRSGARPVNKQPNETYSKRGRNEESILQSYVNKKAGDGLTALDLAASGGHYEAVKMLLQKNAKPSLQALDRARFSGQKEVVKEIFKAVQGAERDEERRQVANAKEKKKPHTIESEKNSQGEEKKRSSEIRTAEIGEE